MIQRYIALYAHLIRLNFIRTIAYRLNFINGTIASIFWAIFSIVAIYILTSRSSFVFGWSRQELFILIGVFNILVGGIFRMLFANNFERFAHIIRFGELDALLLKPVDT